MKIAITGAAGFIGRHVVAELSRRSIAPTLVCRPGRELPDALAGHRIARIDIHDAPADAFARMGHPDIVMHLAWGGLPNYLSLHHFETELPAQYRFLKCLVEAGVGHILVTGTCFEYGERSGQLGEDLDGRPGNSYGLAKDTLRRQLECLREKSDFALTWTRLFYLHGEGQSPASLLPQLQKAVEQGERVFRMSGGEQLRDYLPVSEAARALVVLATSRHGHGIVNVCSGQPVSVRRLVEGWIAEHSWSIDLALGHYPYPAYEPMAFWGDARKLQQIMSSQAAAV